MPSQKTLKEAYWQYTEQRENQALERAKECVRISFRRRDDIALDYIEEAQRNIRRARRLSKLGVMIVGRMY